MSDAFDWSRAKLSLESKPDSELELARRSQRKHSRPRPDAIGRPFRSHGAVHRTQRPIQRSAQPVGGTIEVGEVENIEGRHAGLQNKAVSELEGPGQGQVHGAQPLQAYVICRSGRDIGRVRTQLQQLRSRKQTGIDQRQAGESRPVAEIGVVGSE